MPKTPRTTKAATLTMNVKFKTSRLCGNHKFTGTFRELVLSTIATSISIILTFGTAQYFEHRQKKADARLMAMMVIHDMDNTAKQLREAVEADVKMAEGARYVWENFARLDSMEEYEMNPALSYIIQESSAQWDYPLDDASEKIFLSSQDSWKNINNPGFIDAVQHFYVERHQFFDFINSSPDFRKPIGSDEHFMFLAGCKDVMHYYRQSIIDRLREFMPRKDVQLYMQFSNSRQSTLKNFARHIEQTSTKCKFMMGITDQELDEYVKSQQQAGKRPKGRDLMGRWYLKKERFVEDYYDFSTDHTYKKIFHSYLSTNDFNGLSELTQIETGTWELNGDSLFIVREPEVKFNLDHSKITAKPGKEAETRGFINYWNNYYANQEKAAAAGGAVTANYAVSIDETETKLELKWTTTNEDGKEVTSATYLMKLDE